MTNEIINGQGVKEWIKFNNPVSCESEAAWEGKDNTTEKNYLCTREMVLSDPLISSIKDEIEGIAKLDHDTLKLFAEDIWLSFETMSLQQKQDESKDLKNIK